jgi:hypothetical protein
MTRTITNANAYKQQGNRTRSLHPWGWRNGTTTTRQEQRLCRRCLPFGWIRSFTPHPMQIVQNSEYITFLFEQSTMFRR